MPRRLQVDRIIHIGLYKPEAEIARKIEEKGFLLSEIVREMFRVYGEKYFPEPPAYAKAELMRAETAQKRVEEELEFAAMPNAEYATRILRGKLDGNYVLFRTSHGVDVKFELSKIKEYTVENNEIIRIHNQLLDRSFRYVGGVEPTERQWEGIWKGWE